MITKDNKTEIRQKRQQQVKRQKVILMMAIICLIISAFIYMSVKNNKHEVSQDEMSQEEVIQKEDTIEVSVSEEPKGITPRRTETRKEKVKRVRKEAKEKGYPEDVIELLSKNPETVRFVENYEEQKDRVAALEISELKEGEIPHLLQWDARWGYAPYGTSIVAVCGCGPTCLSMVIAGLTGDKTLTPARIAAYGTEHGYITEENDTRWIFMSKAAKKWGITCKEKKLSEAELKKELKAGHPVICSVGPGAFTKIGHFIVLAGYEDGKIIVHDPFSNNNTEKRWDFQEFEDQIKSMWTYSIDE